MSFRRQRAVCGSGRVARDMAEGTNAVLFVTRQDGRIVEVHATRFLHEPNGLHRAKCRSAGPFRQSVRKDWSRALMRAAENRRNVAGGICWCSTPNRAPARTALRQRGLRRGGPDSGIRHRQSAAVLCRPLTCLKLLERTA